MKLCDIKYTFNKFQQAVKEFPEDFRILIRYMQLLQEDKIFGNTSELIRNSSWKKPSEEIHKIYERIQNNCTDDSIRIWSKRIMISHLLWKYDCLGNDKGEYCVFVEYLNKAEEIIATLPSMADCKELMIHGCKENYYDRHKKALEELIYHMHNELFGFCLNYSVQERIHQYEALQNLLDLIYTDGNYEKKQL